MPRVPVEDVFHSDIQLHLPCDTLIPVMDVGFLQIKIFMPVSADIAIPFRSACERLRSGFEESRVGEQVTSFFHWIPPFMLSPMMCALMISSCRRVPVPFPPNA